MLKRLFLLITILFTFFFSSLVASTGVQNLDLLPPLATLLFVAFGAVAIKSASEIAEKWARVTPMRTEDYSQGVQNPGKDWKNETKAAEARYEQGVQAAIQKKRFGKGVDEAGTSKWQEKTIEKGTQRWGPGVQVAQTDMAEGFEPYRAVISGLTLPQKYPKGDPRNIQRVAAIATALHAKKVA